MCLLHDFEHIMSGIYERYYYVLCYVIIMNRLRWTSLVYVESKFSLYSLVTV